MILKKEKVKIDLLFEKDLKDFLERFKLYDRFVNGKISCEKCSKIITYDNLGILKFENGKIIFICDDPKCIKAAQ
ncbi:MAG: hypothetical protein ISS28_03195 [Candidatus Cloacimonetes bacterium]|nr:hypothetical protein [Candidatus Cloacimonadota bacterium]